jgi:hypothetical protein
VEGKRLYYVSNRGELVCLDTEGFLDGKNDGPFQDETYKGSIDGDIIFIKNIDNIVPDRLKEMTVLHKKILGGYLVQLQDEIFQDVKLLSGSRVEDELLSKVVRFCEKKLFISSLIIGRVLLISSNGIPLL